MTRAPAAAAAALLSLSAAPPRPAAGCTYVRVPSPDGDDALARSLESGGEGADDHASHWNVAVHPRGEAMGERSVCLRGWHTARWANAFAYVSVDRPVPFTPDPFPDLPHDGVNEAGLTMSLHTLRESAYQPLPPPAAGATAVCQMDLVAWGLGLFPTVDALLRGLRNVAVVGALPGVFADFDNFHWAAADAGGAEVVIEYIAGSLRVHNNTVGVLTNDPPFDWHLRNLNNYVALSPDWPAVAPGIAVATEVGAVPRALSDGLSIEALPGGASPAARFVRAFYLRELALRNQPPRNASGALELATALLNALFIVRGSVAAKGGSDGGDPSASRHGFTQFNVIKVPRRRELYFRSYTNMQWRRVDVAKLAAGGRRAVIPLCDGSMGIADATDSLLPPPAA